jgi:hypothetical protein
MRRWWVRQHPVTWLLGALLLLCVPVWLRATTPPYGGERQARATDGSIRRPLAISPADVSRAIALAARYLEWACGPDGKFAYRIDIGSGQASDSYNIVRHAGAMYALAMLNRTQADRQAVDAMVRASTFLRQRYIGPGVHPDLLVVWSKPLPLHSDAELGATALGIVALEAVNEAVPQSVPLDQLEALGRFALFLQRDDGSFVSKYRRESGPVRNWESLYYPGEAALGFLALDRADHDPKWRVAAAKALTYLARSRAKLPTVPADHWALIATAELLGHCDAGSCPASREELIQHAIQICNSIMREQLHDPADARLDGAFDSTGRTTPAATRLEGLLAALEFLPDGDMRKQTDAAVARGIAFLLRAQIGSGPYAGGIPGSVAAGSRSEFVVRIDYVQHALCAWLGYQRLLGNDQPTAR